MLDTCTLAVLTLMNKSSAISWLVRPAARPAEHLALALGQPVDLERILLGRRDVGDQVDAVPPGQGLQLGHLAVRAESKRALIRAAQRGDPGYVDAVGQAGLGLPPPAVGGRQRVTQQVPLSRGLGPLVGIGAFLGPPELGPFGEFPRVVVVRPVAERIVRVARRQTQQLVQLGPLALPGPLVALGLGEVAEGAQTQSRRDAGPVVLVGVFEHGERVENQLVCRCRATRPQLHLGGDLGQVPEPGERCIL